MPIIDVPIDDLRTVVRAAVGPRFLVPARFAHVTFDTFRPDPAFPAQAEALHRVQALVTQPAPTRRDRRWWRRATPMADGPQGIYLDGSPGVGKTHLMVAAFHAAVEPKLFATFDELAAAAGTLGMADLRTFVTRHGLVCIDEVDLRDPGNIMLLTSLMRAIVASGARVLATANADLTTMPGSHGFASDFARELGEIASAFEVLEIAGRDWREGEATAERRDPAAAKRVAFFTWPVLLAFLAETHPMYDAAWLDLVDRVALDRLEALPDTDRALRFVRFIDRVYDRDVELDVVDVPISPDELLAPLAADRRFTLHFARCRSRLIELGAGWRTTGNGRAPTTDGSTGFPAAGSAS